MKYYYKYMAIIILCVVVVVNVYISDRSMISYDVIHVGIIDSGLDFSYEQLSNHQASIVVGDTQACGWDFLNDSMISKEDHSSNCLHGTVCAEIINRYQSTSSNPKYDFVSLKIYQDNETGKIDDLINAIKYAEKQGIQICNMSFHTKYYSKELYNVMKNSSILFVCSAGNNIPFGLNLDEENNSIYPGCFNLDNIITVSAISDDGQLLRSANYGKNSVDIVAIGCNIRSDYSNSEVSGTSFATAKVTAEILHYMLMRSNIPKNKKKILKKIRTQVDEQLQDYVKGGKKIYEAEYE